VIAWLEHFCALFSTFVLFVFYILIMTEHLAYMSTV